MILGQHTQAVRSTIGQLWRVWPLELARAEWYVLIVKDVLTPRTFASSGPATSGLQKESTVSGSPNVEILIAVLTQSSEHTSRSVLVQRAVFRDFCFVQQVGSFICLAIKGKNSGKSMVPLTSASTSLIMSCDSAPVGLCPRDRMTVPSSLVVTVPSPRLSLPTPQTKLSQSPRTRVFQHTTNQFHELSLRSRNNSSATMRGHVTGQVFLFLEPLRSARQLSRSWSQVYMSKQTVEQLSGGQHTG